MFEQHVKTLMNSSTVRKQSENLFICKVAHIIATVLIHKSVFSIKGVKS